MSSAGGVLRSGDYGKVFEPVPGVHSEANADGLRGTPGELHHQFERVPSDRHQLAVLFRATRGDARICNLVCIGVIQ